MSFCRELKTLEPPGEACKSTDIGAMPRAVESETMNGCQILLAIVRFERKLLRTPSGCRVWTGAQTKGGKGRYKIKKLGAKRRLKGKAKPQTNSPPYGKFWVGPDKKNTVQAHVFAAFLAGKIPTLRVPDGCHLDHRCHHGTLCVDCTELVPAAVNFQRAREGAIGRIDLPPPSKRRKGRRLAIPQPSGNPINLSPVAKNA